MLPSASASVLPSLWQIPQAIRDRVGRTAGPQRSMLEEGHLLIIVHQVPGPDESERTPAFFWRAPDGKWQSHGVKSHGQAAISALLKSYDERLHELELLEQAASTARSYHAVLEAVAPVLRSSRGLHRALQQARDFVKADRDLINFRDEAAGVERTAELLLQDAQHGLSFTMARQAEDQADHARQMAVTAHRLNVLAAIFLPLGTLAGIFGMEVRSGLPDRPLNWFLIVAAGIVIGLVLSSIIARRK